MVQKDDPALEAINARREKSPNGPYHFHVTETPETTIRVRLGDTVLAETRGAVVLKEVGKTVYDPVYYIPKTDVAMGRFELVAGKQTHCPIKGDASYWSYRHEGETVDSLAWSYEAPMDYSAAIAGHLAFDPRHVVLEIVPATR